MSQWLTHPQEIFPKIYWCIYCINVYKMFFKLLLFPLVFFYLFFLTKFMSRRIKVARIWRLIMLQYFLIFPMKKVIVFEIIFCNLFPVLTRIIFFHFYFHTLIWTRFCRMKLFTSNGYLLPKYENFFWLEKPKNIFGHLNLIVIQDTLKLRGKMF